MDKQHAAGEQRECCCAGTMEQARKNRRNKSQPWIVLKFTILFTLAIVGYGCYAYTVRVCAPMIKRESDALGGRGLGITFLVVFSILAIMVLWSYTKAVITSPGHARDFVQKCAPPPSQPPMHLVSWGSDYSDIGTSYENMRPAVDHPPPVTVNPPVSSASPPRSHSRSNSAPERVPAPTPSSPSHRASKHSHNRTVSGATVVDSSAAEVSPPPPAAISPPSPQNQAIEMPVLGDDSGLPQRYTRRPPTEPILLPEYRYCPRDELIKPFRTHHCRACGTCVLKYDHHCPWIGQCVGARNQKFFVNFLQWAALLGFWTFASTLSVNAIQKLASAQSLDIEQIVLMILSGVFGLFSAIMLFSQVQQILSNRTTVESLKLRAMKSREQTVLGRLHPWYSFFARKKTKRKWDEEWGKPTTEGNIWWLGSSKLNWEAVMSGNRLWWFLPMGHSPSDGLTYTINPRFDEQGRLRQRKEWPVELR